jgi:hypothetical protein
MACKHPGGMVEEKICLEVTEATDAASMEEFTQRA